MVFDQALCRAYPDAERIYVIQDNWPVHTHPDLLVALEPQATRWFWVLVLNDWGLAPLDDERRRDLLEILDERYQTRSTVVASQLPVAHWHEALGHPTLADAILDRLVHHAHPLALTGESLRKCQPTLTGNPPQSK